MVIRACKYIIIYFTICLSPSIFGCYKGAGTMAVEVTPDQAMQLLDFNQKFDIALLDNVINQFYSGFGQQVCSLVCRIILSAFNVPRCSWTGARAY